MIDRTNSAAPTAEEQLLQKRVNEQSVLIANLYSKLAAALRSNRDLEDVNQRKEAAFGREGREDRGTGAAAAVARRSSKSVPRGVE